MLYVYDYLVSYIVVTKYCFLTQVRVHSTTCVCFFWHMMTRWEKKDQQRIDKVDCCFPRSSGQGNILSKLLREHTIKPAPVYCCHIAKAVRGNPIIIIVMAVLAELPAMPTAPTSQRCVSRRGSHRRGVYRHVMGAQQEEKKTPFSPCPYFLPTFFFVSASTDIAQVIVTLNFSEMTRQAWSIMRSRARSLAQCGARGTTASSRVADWRPSMLQQGPWVLDFSWKRTMYTDLLVW